MQSNLPPAAARPSPVQGDAKGHSSENGSASISGGANKSSNTAARKDAHEEFFMLCLVSYKMNHQGINRILKVDGAGMYEQAQREKVPFY